MVAMTFVVAGVYLGVMLNHYGVIFEHIDIDLHIDDALNDAGGPMRSRGNESAFVVPNIVHFIWFGTDKKMTFIHYISILSAHKMQRPDAIFFHCDHLPVGVWWQRLWRRVPLKLVHREAPRYIHNQTLMHMYHRADVAKLQVGNDTLMHVYTLQVAIAKLHNILILVYVYDRVDVVKL